MCGLGQVPFVSCGRTSFQPLRGRSLVVPDISKWDPEHPEMGLRCMYMVFLAPLTEQIDKRIHGRKARLEPVGHSTANA